MFSKKLSIIITTRNRYSDLIKCIKSLKTSLPGENYELIVVDDASSDTTALINRKFLQKLFINSKIIHLSKQHMMVKSRNIGAKEAKGELILFIDDDNIVNEKMIDNLCSAAGKYPDFGIFGPEMCYANKKPYMDSQKFNFFTGITTRKIVPQKERKERRPLVNFLDKFLVSNFNTREARQEIYETDGIPNVFMVRKEVFKNCGYFDERLIQTFTEMDFSLHVGKIGYKSGIVPSAKTYHQIKAKDDFSPMGLGGKFNQKAYCLMRNRSVMVVRYGNWLQKIIYIIFFSWFWPSIYSILNLKRTDLIKLYFKGYLDGINYFFSRNFINIFE